MRNVVVVGAGAAAGLCAARLMARRDGFKCVIFEQAGELGGIWKYSDHVDEKDAHGVLVSTLASMYKHLRHYSHPRYPEIVGLESYTGKLVHSHNYRTNEQFRGLKVVLLGAGPSGIDIAFEVMDVAKEVWLSHDFQFHLFPEVTKRNKIHEVPGILNILNSTVTFKNGESCNSDALILCTGYNMNLNLLHPICRPTVDDGRLTPLFKHMIHINHPTLAILGVPIQVIPFVLYHQQLLFVLKVLDGSLNLPSVEEMLSDAERDFSCRFELGMPARYAHKMAGGLQWNYLEDLSRLGGIPRLPGVIRKLYECVSVMRKERLDTYRDYRFKILSNDAFEVKSINDQFLFGKD